MPEFSTLAAVDLGLGDFGSGMTCTRDLAIDGCSILFRGAIVTDARRLAFAERAQAQADCGKSSATRHG